MFPLHTMHKMTAQERFSGPTSCEKISTDIEGIMYWEKEGRQGGEGLFQQMLGKFNFGWYTFNTTPNVHEANIKLGGFLSYITKCSA
jgi:hypothetical protein